MVEARQPDSSLCANQVLDWLGVAATDGILDQLERYHTWLGAEAIPAGAVGPGEGDRLWSRHVADSLTFLTAIDEPEAILDVGSGAGLPGIPLAIALPDAELILLDRAESRATLLRRVVRILELENVTVLVGDAESSSFVVDTLVSRASLSPHKLLAVMPRLTPKARTGVVAGSRGGARPTGLPGWEVIEIPAALLGSPGWLLKVSLRG